MARSKEAWPEWYEQALANAQRAGSELATFADQSECERERLKFYRYLKALREDSAHPLHEAARGCVVQWLCAPRTKSKRVLRFEIRTSTANPLVGGEERAEMERQIDIERALREARKEFGQ